MFKLMGYDANGRVVLDTHPDSVGVAMHMIELEIHSFRNPFGAVVFRLYDGSGLVLVNNVR